MKKEFITAEFSSAALNITAGKIDSFRKTEESFGTVRVYKDGKIGVAGAIGRADEAALTEKAEKALSIGIPYESELDGPVTEEHHGVSELPEEKDMIPVFGKLLSDIGEACPNFCISNKIIISSNRAEYRNSNGRHLISSDRSLEVGLLFQHRGSGNLMDAYYEYGGRTYDPEKIVSQCSMLYKAFCNPVPLPKEKIPVVISAGAFFSSLLRNFSGESYASGSSLVSGKLGERLFSEKLTLKDDRNGETNPGACFFDDEGQIADDFRAPLIENGRLVGVTVSKNTAARFNVPVSRTSVSSYDGVPAAGLSGLYVAPTAKELCDIVPGRAIYVSMASGGDTTPDGHFATPVQLAYLLEGGRPVGKLPELNISGDFFSMLGNDFLGSVRGSIDGLNDLCVINMEVTE